MRHTSNRLTLFPNLDTDSSPNVWRAQDRGCEVYHTWRQNTSYVSGLTTTVQICINCHQPRLQKNPLRIRSNFI